MEPYIWILIGLSILFIIIIIVPSHHLSEGEKTVRKEIKKLKRSHYKHQHGIMLKTKDGFTEIDHVVIGSFGIAVIETKYAHGSINGNAGDDYWQQAIGKKHHQMRNPLNQNRNHGDILAKQLKIDRSFINSLIVFPDETNLNVNDPRVIKVSRLKGTLETWKAKKLSKQQIKQLFAILKRIDKASILNRWIHVIGIKIKH